MSNKILGPVERSRTELCLSLAAGLFLVTLGAWQMASAWALLPVSSAVEDMRGLKPLSPETVQDIVAAERLSLGIQENGAGYSDLGSALELQAMPTQDSALLQQATQALTRSVSLAPANPFAWTRLAILSRLQNADSGLVVNFWRMAYMTGPNEDRLHIPRTQLALSIWPALSDEDHANVFADVRSGWQLDKAGVLSMATDSFSTNAIRAALAVDLKQLLAFEASLKTRHQ